jgi:hypothetical protein
LSPQLIAGLPRFGRHPSSFSRSNAPDRQHGPAATNGELNMARKETVVVFDTDRVTAELLLLTMKAVFAGIAISVAMAIPVVMLASGS